MTEIITNGKLANSSLLSQGTSIKAFSDSGLLIGTEPIAPRIVIDIIGLNSSEVNLKFDNDVNILNIFFNTPANTDMTIKVKNGDDMVFYNNITSNYFEGSLYLKTSDTLVLSANNAVNCRIVAQKTFMSFGLVL